MVQTETPAFVAKKKKTLALEMFEKIYPENLLCEGKRVSKVLQTHRTPEPFGTICLRTMLFKCKNPRVSVVMLESAECRVGNGLGRERESRAYFVPDRDLPTFCRPWSLFPPPRVPNKRILFQSRLFSDPPYCIFPT